MSDDKSEQTDDATQRGTDPGAVSDVAAATGNKAADTGLSSSSPSYTKDSDGDDEGMSHAEGAGRSSVSEIGGDD